jgi:hypothetical protein
MSKNITFNVGGTKFEISKDLIQKYPNSELSSLSLSSRREIFIDHNPLAFGVILDYLRYGKLFVPNNVAKEVIELQLREFRIPYDEIAGFGTKNEDDNLPCYEAAISEFAVPYRGYQDSLKDTAINTAIKRYLIFLKLMSCKTKFFLTFCFFCMLKDWKL